MNLQQIQNMRLQKKTDLITSNVYQEFVDRFNEQVGDLKGYDCPLCKNKGQVAVLQDGEDRYKACTCMELRRNHKTQLESLMSQYTLDNYEDKKEWQKSVKRSAVQYLGEQKAWYYIGGSVGAGKTHICTAIVGELAKNKNCSYMLWRDESHRLKAIVNEPEFDQEISKYIYAQVLYIDDFFKGSVTQADINLAYEIINNRYNIQLQTIISSEKLWSEILAIDEAIGSRIGERAGKYIINLKDKPNHRTEGM